jgi:hypothetical protein
MKAGTQEVNRFFSVTITDKWIPTQLNYTKIKTLLKSKAVTAINQF